MTDDPKIHNNGVVACPECGGYQMFLTKIPVRDCYADVYELNCANPGCLWEGEL